MWILDVSLNDKENSKIDNINKLEEFIPPKKETVIGGLDFLDEYILRSEKCDAIPKLFVRNIKTNLEEEIKIVQSCSV